MKTKISIVVEGGVIQEIKSNNKNIDLKVFDYDEAKTMGTTKDVEAQAIKFNKGLDYNV
jgi:hypothetical protein